MYITLLVRREWDSNPRNHKDSSDFKSDAIDQLCHLAKRLALLLIFKTLSLISSFSTKFNHGWIGIFSY